jgi:hypothetical protein
MSAQARLLAKLLFFFGHVPAELGDAGCQPLVAPPPLTAVNEAFPDVERPWANALRSPKLPLDR